MKSPCSSTIQNMFSNPKVSTLIIGDCTVIGPIETTVSNINHSDWALATCADHWNMI